MPDSKVALPPEVARVSGLYRFIPQERFAEFGIDPEDVPLGTFPAEDHPPFLPDRFGGNAYGLGLYEQTALSPRQASLLESLDLDDPTQVAAKQRELNDVLKRLGLLIRYSNSGHPFYLIPAQFVAHFMVEVQARTDLIVDFLSNLLSRRLRESLKVCIVAMHHELLLPEIQTRMPHLDFKVLDSLPAFAGKHGPFAAVVMVGGPMEIAMAHRGRDRMQTPGGSADREAYGFFMAGHLWDMLEEDGEVLCLADRPLGGSNATCNVKFSSQGEYKRFLMFSHVYRTRRRYKSGKDLKLKVNLFDFHTYLSGLFVYHETVEGLLEGRSLAQVVPKEIDKLPYQDLPLTRGSAKKALAAWQRWFNPFFAIERQGTVLPDVQLREWESKYQREGEFPDTIMVLEGKRRRPSVSYSNIVSQLNRQRLAGCDQGLLAGYKDSFAYVHKVLDILDQARAGTLKGLPGLELSRLRKPFETVHRNQAHSDVLKLMEQASRLGQLESRLNPEGLVGRRTPVLANLEKLSLLGLAEGPLKQLYLIVLGHSTMVRVTFGKLPETTLQPLTDLSRYRSLQEGITIIRLFRLLSVAEAAAASITGLTDEQVGEMFALYDDAIRVITDPGLGWQDILNQQISRLGGVQAKSFRKMLKLFDLFEFIDSWRALEQAGPRLKEAMADYDLAKLERINRVVELSGQVRQFVERYYAGDSMSRPYFFRALLNCELHGTGRLLPRLGAAAGFTLLWICVHTSERRILNFNKLVEVGGEAELEKRLVKLRQALRDLKPSQLSPDWLSSMRGELADGGEAYILDSGIYLTLDKATGALTPRFVDVADSLGSLKQEMDHGLDQELNLVQDDTLQAMDQGLHWVQRFLAAQEQQTPRKEPGSPRMVKMARQESRLRRRLEDYLLGELFNLPLFAVNLKRLIQDCPRVMDRLLPRPSGHDHTEWSLRAAKMLSALQMRRLDLFQDMHKSHEAARAEFGPTAAGIVGVSPLQFQTLTASMTQLVSVYGGDGVAKLLMLAVLLAEAWGKEKAYRDLKSHPLVRGAGLEKARIEDLAFIIEHKDLFLRMLNGENTPLCLAPLVKRKDPVAVELIFLLSVIFTAASAEGRLTEDLLARFFWLLRRVRGLMSDGAPATSAHKSSIEEYATQHLALMHYHDIQKGDAPTTSLRHLLENTKLPEEGRDQLLQEGARQFGLERILRLRGLLYITWLDLELLHQQVPVVYIYRLKSLRSLGVTHFERDLYEGLRIRRGLNSLDQEQRDYLLLGLGAPANELGISDYAAAAERLTYSNQVKLMFLGLAAVRELKWDPPPDRISFAPLAEVMDRKFEMVNEAIIDLDLGALIQKPRILKSMQKAREGLRLNYDPASRELSLAISDPVSLDRKIEAVRKAKDVRKLKRLYHQELKKLKLTHYHTLDFGERLEKAFQENLARLGEEMMERTRNEMAEAYSLDELEKLFNRAWDEGLGIPLSRDRQQSLRDLYELNSERIRAAFLEKVSRQLAEVQSLSDLDALWAKVKKFMKSQERHLGQDFDLIVAQRFDRRAWELSQGN
jgi:hypothetical protein